MISRRCFLIAASGNGLSSACRGALAQDTAKIFKIGLVSPFAPSNTTLWHKAFRLGLRDLGWIDGRNVAIEERHADGHYDRLDGLIADLIHRKVDVIVCSVTPDAEAAKRATPVIPIVIVSVSDPVAIGLVASLAHPGGNITGLSQMVPELTGKRLEVLKEILPHLTAAAVLWNPDDTASTLSWNDVQAPAHALGVTLHSAEARSPSDLERALADAARARLDALYIMPSPLFVTHLGRLAALATEHHLPSIFHLSEFAHAGGLAGYGVDRSDLFRRAAGYVDKILKGANPGDLPIEQPTKFELVINLKTAKVFGLVIPQSILLRADEVIE